MPGGDREIRQQNAQNLAVHSASVCPDALKIYRPWKIPWAIFVQSVESSGNGYDTILTTTGKWTILYLYKKRKIPKYE